MSEADITCPRCGGPTGRSLGDAGSALPWFSCTACHHVWAGGLPDRPPVVETRTRPEATIGKQILVVDDDALMLSIVERALKGYRVTTARDGHEALVVLSSDQHVDLLITDYLMPGMTGNELVQRARLARPDLAVLVMTGHGHIIASAESTWWAGEEHIEKPFLIGELRAAVENLLNASPPAAPP